MEKKGTDSAVASFLKNNSNERLNKTTKRPEVKKIDPKQDDISKLND